MRKGLGGKRIVFKAIRRLSEVLNIFLMFEIFLVSSWDINHSKFGIQTQILVSRQYLVCDSRLISASPPP